MAYKTMNGGDPNVDSGQTISADTGRFAEPESGSRALFAQALLTY